jgi:acetoin utilization protein AcuC
MESVFVHSPDLKNYSYGEGTPLVGARSARTLELCAQRDIIDTDQDVATPPKATRREVERFHTPAYLDLLQQAESGRVSPQWLTHGLGSPETPVFKGLWEYSMIVAGGSLLAARKVIAGACERVFHPGGGLHHAHPALAGGFCYVNDVVLAVLELRAHGLRVAVIDVDAHHGDGTQKAFYADPDVLTVSVHESGKTLFPWGGAHTELGSGSGEGYNVNVPLPVGTYDEAYVRVIDEVVVPRVKAFAPDVLFAEVGADTLAVDPLTHLSLTNNGIVETLERFDALNLPWIVVGGGGYAVEPSVRAWTLVWSIVAQRPLEDPYAGVIGGMMTGLSEIEAGNLRDRPLYVTPEDKKRITAELEPILRFHRQRLG